jgi:tetratricopeptide (TPR) repeat protein
MRHRFLLVAAILLASILLGRAEGVDERYVLIYNMIQEADGLNEAGQGREAAVRYLDAQKALKSLQADYPGWNGNVVTFRLNYIASKLDPLVQKTEPTNAPPVLAEGVPAAPASTNQLLGQINEMQAEIKRLTKLNSELQDRVKEALSVQPAQLDPRELAKAEDQIRFLQKEKDLLKVSLEQERAKSVAPASSGALDQERQILADVKRKLAEQTEATLALQKENEILKKQLADSKPSAAIENPGSADLAQQLQSAKATLAELQTSNLTLRAEQILLEGRVAELAKQPKRGKSSAPRPDDQARQLEVALARLAVYEAKPLPYTPEELALFKQPDLKASITEPAPMKRSSKSLPPGAGPLVEEAVRAAEAEHYPEAEKKFQEVLRQDDKNLYILGNLAAVQLEQDRFADAEKTLAQAMAVDSHDPACLYTLGRLKYRQEKYDEALDALSLSAKLIPDEPRTQYFLGKTLIQKGNRTAAEAALRKAVHLRPNWADAHFSLAMVYATQQPPFKELAQWHYQKAIAAGLPRNLEFERLLEEKKTTAANP